MKICVISASQRINSQSEKIAHYIEMLLKGNNKVAGVDILTLAANPIPLIEMDFFDDNCEKWQSLWQPITKKLAIADGFVFVVPEWGGMVPPAFKNFLLLCSGTVLAHKPAMLVGVSAHTGGAYPISELRTSGYKNTRICYIPDNVIIRDCEKVLNESDSESPTDEYIRKRILYTTQVLVEYAVALKPIRNGGIINFVDYPNGM